MKQPQKATVDSISDVSINIVGNNMLQNDLLLSFLNNTTGLKGNCLSIPELKAITVKSDSVPSKFILIDYNSIDAKHFSKEINTLKKSIGPGHLVALCNVESNAKIEKTAMNNSIAGVFYDSDPPQTISKGIVAILNGDLWYTRKAMAKHLSEPKPFVNSMEPASAKESLTSREREVLTLIASGHTSKDISDKLCVSSHTVKNHIYSIYNKLNVTNRLQATLWADQHL